MKAPARAPRPTCLRPWGPIGWRNSAVVSYGEEVDCAKCTRPETGQWAKKYGGPVESQINNDRGLTSMLQSESSKKYHKYATGAKLTSFIEGTSNGTWSICTLNQCGKVRQLTHELETGLAITLMDNRMYIECWPSRKGWTGSGAATSSFANNHRLYHQVHVFYPTHACWLRNRT